MHPLPNKACTDLFHIVLSVIKAERGATFTCNWSNEDYVYAAYGGMTTTHRRNLKNSRLKILFSYKDKKDHYF